MHMEHLSDVFSEIDTSEAYQNASRSNGLIWLVFALCSFISPYKDFYNIKMLHFMRRKLLGHLMSICAFKVKLVSRV